MTDQLTDDAIDTIMVGISEYVQDTLGVNLEDDTLYEPFADHVRGLLAPYSDGQRNYN